jgi:hypothetical protein
MTTTYEFPVVAMLDQVSLPPAAPEDGLEGSVAQTALPPDRMTSDEFIQSAAEAHVDRIIAEAR